ncbi:hypothetical protein AB3347_13010 [Massilia sp. X63]|jgi:hypothetical protein
MDARPRQAFHPFPENLLQSTLLFVSAVLHFYENGIFDNEKMWINNVLIVIDYLYELTQKRS